MSAAPAPVTDGSHTRAVGARTGAFFTAHGRMVFAVCRAVLRDADEAADATQATFLSAHEALLKGTEIRDPGAWLATIARNECRALLRGRTFDSLPLHEERICASLMTDDDVERRATVDFLRLAIGSLPEKQREAVVLRDLYGLHYGEIGKALGVSRPSVEALLFRARRTLRLRLRPAAGGVLAVPLAVKEGLAQAIPFFATGGSTPARAAGIGAGVVAKVAWPAAAKVMAGAVVVGATGLAFAPQPPSAPEAAPALGRPSEVRGAAPPTARRVEAKHSATKRRSSLPAVVRAAHVEAQERVRGGGGVEAPARPSRTESRTGPTTTTARVSGLAPERSAQPTRNGGAVPVSPKRPEATARGSSVPERAETGAGPSEPATRGNEAPGAAPTEERVLSVDEQTREGPPDVPTATPVSPSPVAGPVARSQ